MTDSTFWLIIANIYFVGAVSNEDRNIGFSLMISAFAATLLSVST